MSYISEGKMYFFLKFIYKEAFFLGSEYLFFLAGFFFFWATHTHKHCGLCLCESRTRDPWYALLQSQQLDCGTNALHAFFLVLFFLVIAFFLVCESFKRYPVGFHALRLCQGFFFFFGRAVPRLEMVRLIWHGPYVTVWGYTQIATLTKKSTVCHSIKFPRFTTKK